MAKQSSKGRKKGRGGVPMEALLMVAALALALIGAGLLAPGQDAAAPLPVVISRVMSSNPSLCYAVDGNYYDWIELANASQAAVDLKGWKLTDSKDLRDAWVFGERVLEPGQTLIVYCDTRPEGYAGDAMFTGFKLSGDGELLLLADPAQHLTALEVPALAKGEVYQRDEAGEYRAALFDGAAGPRGGSSAPVFDPNGLMISELMPMNRSTLADMDGDFSDWIELYNGSARAINLENYALSDSERSLRKWVFPAVTLQPGQYLVVFASGKNRRDPGGELHTSFRLSGDGELIRLSDPDGRVISQIEYEGVETDQALTRDMSGAVSLSEAPSPGTALAGTAKLMENGYGLYINEVCSGGLDGDWVELRNAGGTPIDLQDMGLSDDPGKPRRWQFPAGAVIQPGGYVVVAFGTGRSEDSTLRPDFTCDMGISEGETVCLATPDGRIIDRLTVAASVEGSVGRAEGYDTPRWFSETTPGGLNAGTSYEKALREIVFSPGAGLVRDGAVTVTMTTDPGVAIYYTTDGSTPTTSSSVYTGPITLTETTCVRALAALGDTLISQPCAATYVFGPHTHRLVCVSGDPDAISNENGMLNTGAKDANAPVYVEIYEPDGTRLIGQSCLMTITGHNTREKNSQRSFKLNARRAYGSSRFRAKLFGNRDEDAFKALLLRCSGQDYQKTHMLDSVLTALMDGTYVDYQETEVCVLYVNGQYWGLYELREHVDKHSVAQWAGFKDVSKVNLVHGTLDKIDASAGKSDDYKALLEWVGKTDLSQAENLQKLRENMIVESYLDYVIMQMYTCNQDLSNIRAYRSLTEDKRWRFVIYDFDLSYRLNAENYVDDWFERRAGTITAQDTKLFRQLMKNDGVRDYFLTRVGQLTVEKYNPERVVSRIQARRDLIKDEMVRNCQRWSWSYATWEEEVARILDYARVRPGIFIDYVCQAFNLNDSQKQQYFGEALQKIAEYNG